MVYTIEWICSIERQHPIKKKKRRKSVGGYSENLKMDAQLTATSNISHNVLPVEGR